MLHARVSYEYIHFSLMLTTHNIFLYLPIKHLITGYGKPTTPHKLVAGTKPSLSNILVIYFLFVVLKATARVDVKVSNMHHQSQKEFWGILGGIPQHQKG